MTLIVDQSFELSSTRATAAEKATRVDVWTRMLFHAIPEDRLDDCFLHAFRSHDTPFPISAYELMTSWRIIEANELASRQAANQVRSEISTIDACSNKYNHINDDGETLVVDPWNFKQDIIIPCFFCRRIAHDQAKDRHNARHAGELNVEPQDENIDPPYRKFIKAAAIIEQWAVNQWNRQEDKAA